MSGIPERFDLTGPLPAPATTTLLEASAGTGKTFAVAALVTRFVAEGVATLPELLVITFGRAASQELRERVRAQLVEAERALAVDAAPAPNVLVAHLLALPDRGLVLERIRDALASFDAATIATTHQFCQLVLRSLGVAGDTDPGAELVDDLDDLVVEVVEDDYLRRFAGVESPPLSLERALRIGRLAVGDPQATLVPEPDGPSSGDEPAALRVALAREVRAEVDRRKRRRGLLGYDDLLSRLADALADGPTGDSPARERMRLRWRVVLVDEFQDTDPVQWQVIRRAFHGVATVVLIGDPKQSIYAFRGGDVHTYLSARDDADHEATLAENHRSDADLVRALGVLLHAAELGDPRIAVRPVEPALPATRLRGAPVAAPLRLRAVERGHLGSTKQGEIYVGEARAHIARDCAADIARLLGSGATWDDRPLLAGDVAVLVHVRDHGMLVQRELRRRGIPAVMAGGGHVVLTEAGDAWLTLLEALDAPHRTGRVRAAAVTAFVGESAESLDAGGEALTDRVADRLRGWALLVRSAGVSAVVEAAEEGGLAARVLAHAGGERLLTDLRHVGHLLHETATADGLGLAGLLAWLRDQRARDRPTTERTRRLDSDAAAVQILTIHAAKGLQYPVVYLPFAYEARSTAKDELLLFHDAAGRRCLDVSGGGPGWSDRKAAHRTEAAGETLRTCYVALTRAQSQVVAWWAPTTTTAGGGLHRLLFGRQPDVGPVPENLPLRDDAYVTGVLRRWQERGGPRYEPSVVDEPLGLVTAPTPPQLAARRFERPVDTDWRRTSYSGLIAVEADQPPGVTSEPETTPVLDEEPATYAAPAPLRAALLAPGVLPLEPATRHTGVASPMAELPAGATFGSLVHAVLEHTDPQSPDLVAALREQVVEQLRWWPVGVGVDELAAALVPMQHTPLGPLAPGVTLADIPLTDRLRELDFELPLAGGDGRAADESRPEVRLRDLAPLLRTHLPADDPLAGYAARLTTPALGDQRLVGYLAGSVDALLRVPSDEAGLPGGHRYLVVDYKTNLLGDPDEPLTTDDYGPAELAEAMLHSHYPLQALLYCVVAHRFLRWRLPGYDPERHLGGVLYLFVRGMAGPQTPLVDGHPGGVFSWRPPAGLVVALSELLDGGAT